MQLRSKEHQCVSPVRPSVPACQSLRKRQRRPRRFHCRIVALDDNQEERGLWGRATNNLEVIVRSLPKAWRKYKSQATGWVVWRDDQKMETDDDGHPRVVTEGTDIAWDGQFIWAHPEQDAALQQRLDKVMAAG